jgi:vacuolar-type H+-ATPase subunit E/Vma4
MSLEMDRFKKKMDNRQLKFEKEINAKYERLHDIVENKMRDIVIAFLNEIVDVDISTGESITAKNYVT